MKHPAKSVLFSCGLLIAYLLSVVLGENKTIAAENSTALHECIGLILGAGLV